MISYLSSSQIWPPSAVAYLFLGELVGSLFFGPYADWKGRRKSFLVSCGFICGWSFVSAFVGLEKICWTEFCVGIGVGGFTIPFDILSESHSSSLRRASLVVQINYFWALGAILVPLLEYLNFVLLNKTWRTFVIICSLPSLFALIIGYFVVRESEIWLKTQHKTTDESTISSLSSNSTILNTSSLISERANEIITSLGWYQTISLWMIWFSKSFSYYGMVIVTSRIFSSDDGWDYRRSFFSCGSEVVGTWMTGVLADRVGRIPTMMWSFLLAGVFLLSFTIYDHIALCVIGRVMLVLAVNTTWIATPELYETSVRATGHGAANFFSRGGALIASVYLVHDSMSTEQCGIWLLLFCLIGSICSYALPETKGVNLETNQLQERLITTTVTIEMDVRELDKRTAERTQREKERHERIEGMGSKNIV